MLWRLLLAAVLFVSATVATAEGRVSTWGLSELQIEKLNEAASQMKQKNLAPSDGLSTAKQVNEWVDVGSNIGKGLAGAAKEVGATVNDFAKTPVGLITTVVIVYKFMGESMLRIVTHIGSAFCVVIFGWAFVLWYARGCRSRVRRFYEDKVDIFGRSRLQSEELGRLPDDVKVVVVVAVIVTLAASIIIGIGTL